LFVTLLVYTAITWMRRTRAALMAVGMLILGIVYLAARALELQLTAWIFQGFFAIFVIIIVVIFQEELRQLFERLAVWSLRRGETRASDSDPTVILVECLTDFARSRIGALIVLPGRQPVQRHLSGGYPLDGQLSLPLLQSIFDPHSPGHDGAVVVERARVSRFAVHLPLSQSTGLIAGLGTRHCAALGLAERTDALCLVASEERGTISVAQRGALRRLSSAQELVPILRQFFEELRPVPRRRWLWHHLMRENWGEKAGALLLVMGLWYLLVAGSRPTEKIFAVPVKVLNLPSHLELEAVQPAKVGVTLLGPSNAFYLFDPRDLELSVDASQAQAGRRTLRLLEANLRHPADLTFEEFIPPQVRISVRELPAKRAGPRR